MRRFTAFTSAVLTTLVTYSFVLLVCAKVAGFQLRPVALSELGIRVEPPYIVLLLGLATVFISLLGDLEDECLSAALLSALICAELGTLFPPYHIATVCSKIFEKIAQGLAALACKTLWELIKSFIREHYGGVTTGGGIPDAPEHVVGGEEANAIP